MLNLIYCILRLLRLAVTVGLCFVFCLGGGGVLFCLGFFFLVF